MPYFIFSDVTGFKSNEPFNQMALAKAELARMRRADPAGQWQISFKPGLTVEPVAGRRRRKG